MFVKGAYNTGFIAERMEGLKIEAHQAGGAGGSPRPSQKEAREVEVEVNGKLFRVKVYADETQGRPGGVKAPPARRGREKGRGVAAIDGAVVAPMQGTIVKVLVEEGQEVAADEAVCVLEAMKMESEIRVKRAGTISEVLVEAGQTVRSGDALIALE